MKQSKTTWIAAAAGTLLCMGLGVRAQDIKPATPSSAGMREEGATLNFDKDAVGKLPAGWKAAESPGKAGDDPGRDPVKPGKEPKDSKDLPGYLKATWAVSADPTAPTAPNVLEIRSSIQGMNGYNICICEKHSHKDVDLAAKLRGNTGKLEQGGGVAWRVKNAENFYGCAYNAADGKFRVFKVIDGRSQELGTADFKGSGPDASTWYTVSAQMIGDTITCSINGQELLHATDASIKDSGHIALWTRADATTSFDDVMIKNAAGEKKDLDKKDLKEPPPKGAVPKDE